jgi:hypothetical protein
LSYIDGFRLIFRLPLIFSTCHFIDAAIFDIDSWLLLIFILRLMIISFQILRLLPLTPLLITPMLLMIFQLI